MGPSTYKINKILHKQEYETCTFDHFYYSSHTSCDVHLQINFSFELYALIEGESVVVCKPHINKINVLNRCIKICLTVVDMASVWLQSRNNHRF